MSRQSCINVVVAVITDTAGRILITRRSFQSSHGGYWEFPGGKIKPFEEKQAALFREIDEELGLQILTYSSLGQVVHAYPAYSVCLSVFHIEEYTGFPECKEGQLDMQWVSLEQLKTLQFPEANYRIIEELLPALSID